MLEIYGASDDLVEVDGDVSEEFNHYSPAEPKATYLACSDGSVFMIQYLEGIWRINQKAKGTAQVRKEECMKEDGSDHVFLTGVPIEWVVFGEFARQGK